MCIRDSVANCCVPSRHPGQHWSDPGVRSNRLQTSYREDWPMSRTRRTIGVSAFIILVLGTGWALEKAFSNSHTGVGTVVIERSNMSDTVIAPVTPERSAESRDG